MAMAHRKDPSRSVHALYAQRMKREREKAAFTQAEVAPKVNVSVQLYGHFETCYRVPTMDVSKKLDGLYGLEEYFEGLQPLVVREVETPTDLPDYVEDEGQAALIRLYQPLLIPGLLQTEAYARAVLLSTKREDQIEQPLAERVRRQETLRREPAPTVVAVLKESVLREPVGGSAVMREQLGHLLDLSCEPTITVQVIPAGSPVYVTGNITLLGFEEGLDLAYVESARSIDRVVAAANVRRLQAKFELLRSLALDTAASDKLIREILESL
ncbi:helix-turn-helix domain-containing protein [Actinomadura scrupuli]|uniref:helix-turn-helix domain-containing protein n=1 Tax=Actinomadura scrupuli TaxID=559629 RepID=UPI003D994A09